MIKVKDLIEALKKYDPELPILAAADDEGNSYHGIYTPVEYFCPELNEHCIEIVYPTNFFDEAIDDGYEPVVNCLIV